MFRKIIDGTIRIPSRKEVIDRTKLVILQDVYSGDDNANIALLRIYMKDFIYVMTTAICGTINAISKRQAVIRLSL